MEERIDELKFEEAALQRRHKMENGPGARLESSGLGARLVTYEDSLNLLQAERRRLGKCYNI